MNRALNPQSTARLPRSFYEVTYIPGGYSETLARRVPTEQFHDEDYAVDQLVSETYDRGDEPIDIRRQPENKVLWQNKSYL